VPQNQECKFFYQNAEAIATFKFYINRLLAMSIVVVAMMIALFQTS
jgi:hypothetical protein